MRVGGIIFLEKYLEIRLLWGGNLGGGLGLDLSFLLGLVKVLGLGLAIASLLAKNWLILGCLLGCLRLGSP